MFKLAHLVLAETSFGQAHGSGQPYSNSSCGINLTHGFSNGPQRYFEIACVLFVSFKKLPKRRSFRRPHVSPLTAAFDLKATARWFLFSARHSARGSVRSALAQQPGLQGPRATSGFKSMGQSKRNPVSILAGSSSPVGCLWVHSLSPQKRGEVRASQNILNIGIPQIVQSDQHP